MLSFHGLLHLHLKLSHPLDIESKDSVYIMTLGMCKAHIIFPELPSTIRR